METQPRGLSAQKMRYLVTMFSLLLIVINGCDAVYFDTEDNLQRLHQEQKEVRVLTLRHPLIFQKDSRGKTFGIDHDLLQDFAHARGLHVQFIVKKDERELYESLARGEGDVIAARLRGDGAFMKGFLTGPAYEETHLSLFCRNRTKVSDIKDLDGKSVALMEKDNDLFIETRLKLLAPLMNFQKIVNSNAKQLLWMTQKGQFDCAFAEDVEGSYFLRAYPNVYKVGAVSDKYSLNWILRPEHQDLQILMQQWFQQASRRDEIMRVQDRYHTFMSSIDADDVRHFTTRIQSVFPTYSDAFKSAAKHYELDWRLLGAIAFQESHWNPEAVSYTGVRGLMQLTQSTAEMAGILDRTDPLQSIWGGAFYFKHLWDRLPSDIHSKDKLALTLAAYNMGYGHLLDAQKLVRQRGRNPYSWRDIKAVLPLLSDPSYTSELEYGPARGFETMEFVDRVRGYYNLWKTLEG